MDEDTPITSTSCRFLSLLGGFKSFKVVRNKFLISGGPLLTHRLSVVLYLLSHSLLGILSERFDLTLLWSHPTSADICSSTFPTMYLLPVRCISNSETLCLIDDQRALLVIWAMFNWKIYFIALLWLKRSINNSFSHCPALAASYSVKHTYVTRNHENEKHTGVRQSQLAHRSINIFCKSAEITPQLSPESAHVVHSRLQIRLHSAAAKRTTRL